MTEQVVSKGHWRCLF